MAIRDWPEDARPREKLLKQGAAVLSDAELVAVFLRTGMVGKSAVDLGRDLIARFGEDGQAAKPPTVYRALEFLERQGMAHRIASISAYVACAGHEENTAPHAAAFLICDCCGATREINGPDQGAMDAAAAAAGYAIARTTIEAHGLCAACRQAA